MSVRVGINGFGRIGRALVRAVYTDPVPGVQVVAVNDLQSAEDLAYMLRHDSTRNDFPLPVRHVGRDAIGIDDHTIRTFSYLEPADIPWRSFGADVVIESTGAFRNGKEAAEHINGGGAKKVIISASAHQPHAVLVPGANLDSYHPALHHVISPASCGINALAVMCAALMGNWAIQKVTTTVWLATQPWQRPQDGLDSARHDPLLGRALGENIIPHDHVDGTLLRTVLPDLPPVLYFNYCAPPPLGSLAQLVLQLHPVPSPAQVNYHLKKMAAGPLAGLLAVTDDRPASSDVRGHPASALVDLTGTRVVDGQVGLRGFFDGEWGFVHRLLDLARLVSPE